MRCPDDQRIEQPHARAGRELERAEGYGEGEDERAQFPAVENGNHDDLLRVRGSGYRL